MVPTLVHTDMTTGRLNEIRLMQLISPSLPTGGFSYSQGLEWAVEADWVTDSYSLGKWLTTSLAASLHYVDIPILKRMYNGCVANDADDLRRLSALLFSCRESREIVDEERNRGRALASLLHSLGVIEEDGWRAILTQSQLAGFAYASAKWEIPFEQAAMGYLWAWLENQVIAGIKIIPLGQTEGQKLLLDLAEKIEDTVQSGQHVTDEEIGGASPALALASSLHETQYTRLYRS